MIQTEIQTTRVIGEIRKRLEEFALAPRFYDTTKLAVEIYHLTHLCPYCGCNVAVEKEVFGKDTKHTCRGTFKEK